VLSSYWKDSYSVKRIKLYSVFISNPLAVVKYKMLSV
jgi:hypothetical protein